ncbi:hypothetical protein [Verminephrobacter aporrectodeae]|uniref:hypothetical protein n=1 Tax=Verminephrobacter aporrectodeae TaxID=1110389 RepID=UPI002238A8AC|nr:hypothetical protein [Verminephrobacter aporrectodeae]
MTQAQSDQLRAYDAMAPLYAQYSNRYRNYLDAVDQLVIDRLEPGIRLLDLGSGDGRRLHRIFRRRLLDALAFDEKRGDVHYQWQIGQQSLPSSGHLFTPAEMAGLFSGRVCTWPSGCR